MMGTTSVWDMAALYDPDAEKPVIDAVERIAAERGVPMAQIALAWVLANPIVSAPIVGATKQHHLADAAAAVELTLTSGEVDELNAHYVVRQPAGY